MTAGQTKTVTFVTRDQCAICEVALGRLQIPSRLLGVAVITVDVDADAELSTLYGDRVPVVMDAEGAVLAEGRISRREAWRAAWRARRV